MSGLLPWILENQEGFRENRLPSLYSDFSTQRHSNPDGFATNVAAWQQALAQAALAGRLTATTTPAASSEARRQHAGGDAVCVLRAGDQLVSALETRRYGRPVALQCVIDEAISSGALMPLSDFLDARTSPFAKSWLPRLALPQPPSLGQVLGWGVRTLRGLVIGAENGSDYGLGSVRRQDLVIVENLKILAQHVVTAMKQRASDATTLVDRVFAKRTFVDEYCTWHDAPLSDADVDVLLTYLSRDVQKVAYDGKTVKILTPADREHPASLPTVTEEDTTIASLKRTLRELERHTARLDAQIGALTTQVRTALAAKNRVAAAAALRQRRLAERALQTRSDTRLRLEEVLLALQQAHDQAALVGVLRDSARALRALNARAGGAESVREVVDELREEMEGVDEVAEVLREGPGAGVGMREDADEEEQQIEEELARMLGEASQAGAEDAAEAAAAAEAETKRKLAALEAFEREARAKKERRAAGDPGSGVLAASPGGDAEDAEMDAELEQSLGRLSIQAQDLESESSPEQAERGGRVPAR